jgi:uncharacterized protein YoxC
MKAVSAIIATIIIVLITVVGIALVLMVVTPTLNKAKESAVINEAMQNMKVLDNTVRQVASEGSGSLRSVQIRVTDGEYKVQNKTNTIEFTLSMVSGIIEPGTFVQEGNLFLTSGVTAKASEWNLTGGTSNDLVLENEIMRVGIRKVGSRSSPAAIDTSNIVEMLNFKETGVNVTFNDSSVFLDDFADSNSGTGFSELVRVDDHLTKAEALVHVNSTNIAYDIIYTLPSGADFLTVKIQNANYN